jgi:hypothetical protein
MNMVIYNTRKQIKPCGIYHLIGSASFWLREDTGYLSIGDKDGCLESFPFVDESCMLNECGRHDF